MQLRSEKKIMDIIEESHIFKVSWSLDESLMYMAGLKDDRLLALSRKMGGIEDEIT